MVVAKSPQNKAQREGLRKPQAHDLNTTPPQLITLKRAKERAKPLLLPTPAKAVVCSFLRFALPPLATLLDSYRRPKSRY